MFSATIRGHAKNAPLPGRQQKGVAALRLKDLIQEEGAALAPMAGVADRAFRQLCRELGAVYTVGEMASAKGLLLGGKIGRASCRERV